MIILEQISFMTGITELLTTYRQRNTCILCSWAVDWVKIF